jgi:DNA invertase Pin-like site-specific DNA recombinase
MRASTYGRQSSNKAKSIEEQLDAGHLVIDEQSWTNAGDYQDGRSASRFGTKVRGGWAQVLADVTKRDASFDILILWESSRGDRTPETWFAFLTSCRENNVKLHIISHDRTYNLSNARDWKTLAEDGVNNAYESELLSIRTRRGHAGAAKKGLPPGGPTPYGYKRTFDENTGKRLGQVPDTKVTKIVIKIFKDISQGKTIMGIANALNASLSPERPWTPNRVRNLAKNPVYVAVRRHKGMEHPGQWEPIVDKKLFYSVQGVLSQPERRVTRPGRQKYLLSYLARCEPCGSYLEHVKTWYRCSSPQHCVNIPSVELDAAITQLVIARLQQDDAMEALAKSGQEGAGNRGTLEGEIAQLETRLKEFRAKAIKGLVSIETLNMAEETLTADILRLKQQLRQQSVPAVVLEMAGPDAEARWEAATLIARRAVINALCEIRIAGGFKGTRFADREKLTLKRLRPSRWHGDTRTLGQIWDEGR